MRRIPKFYALAVFALAILLAVTMPVAANDIEGSLTRLNADSHTFTVTDELGNARDLRLRVDGAVFINEREATIWDLKIGDRVEVTFEIDAYDLVATVIRATRDGTLP
jgi:hypothetical protein